MTEANYLRQYRLYLQAIKRWLNPSLARRANDRLPFLDRFGGVYYLYVRGMNGRDETTGVYFHRATQQELDLDFVLKNA